VGRNLHEEPAIPCFTAGKREDTPEIKDGMALAIEVMYCLGSENLVLESDGWTIATADGKISALFEETVAVTPDGPLVLT
jgi:methionyl aminopeptidase